MKAEIHDFAEHLEEIARDVRRLAERVPGAVAELDPEEIGEKFERLAVLEAREAANAAALGVDDADDTAAIDHAIQSRAEVLAEARALLAALRPIFGHALAPDAEPEFLDVRVAMLRTEKAIASCGA